MTQVCRDGQLSAFAARIQRYATRYWKRKGMTEWPRVEKTARSLGIRQADVLEACSGAEELMLTGYNFEEVGERLGVLRVEVLSQEVDEAWCLYWLPHSSGCFCGKHTKG